METHRKKGRQLAVKHSASLLVRLPQLRHRLRVMMVSVRGNETINSAVADTVIVSTSSRTYAKLRVEKRC